MTTSWPPLQVGDIIRSRHFRFRVANVNDLGDVWLHGIGCHDCHMWHSPENLYEWGYRIELGAMLEDDDVQAQGG